MNSPLLPVQDSAERPPRSSSDHSASSTESHRDGVQRKLRRAILLSITLMFLEIIGGVVSGSLAIVTDAAHLLSDVSGFAVSLFAVALSQKGASSHYTYGYHQAEILGALTSVLIVWAMTGVLLFEAIQRFVVLREVDGRLMLIMATVGLVVNFALFGTLHHDHDHGHSHGHSHDHGHSHSHSHDHEHTHKAHTHDHTHNHGHCSHSHSSHGASPPATPEFSGPRSQRGILSPSDEIVEAATRGHTNLALDAAVIHIIGDTIQSVGVLLAALLIVWQPWDIGTTAEGISNWYYADPACTILFSILVMFTTFRTIRQSVSVLMHRVPESVNIANFDTKLRDIPGVLCCHDVHVWSVGSSNVIATVHVVVDNCNSCGDVLRACKKIAEEMGIGHSTFQIEVEGNFDHAQETFGDLHERDEQCCGAANGARSLCCP